MYPPRFEIQPRQHNYGMGYFKNWLRTKNIRRALNCFENNPPIPFPPRPRTSVPLTHQQLSSLLEGLETALANAQQVNRLLRELPSTDRASVAIRQPATETELTIYGLQQFVTNLLQRPAA